MSFKFYVQFVNYLEDISKVPFCQVNLNEDKLKAFVYAVRNHYWYQMYIDDLPIWGKLICMHSLV